MGCIVGQQSALALAALRGCTRAVLLLAWAVQPASADDMAFDDRCGTGQTHAQGIPNVGWKAPKSGALSGEAGHACWLRFETTAHASRVPKIIGAGGFKAVTLLNAKGQAPASATDHGPRTQALGWDNDVSAAGDGSGSQAWALAIHAADARRHAFRLGSRQRNNGGTSAIFA